MLPSASNSTSSPVRTHLRKTETSVTSGTGYVFPNCLTHPPGRSQQSWAHHELRLNVDDSKEDLRLRVLPIPECVGWALHNQFATFAKLREGAIFLYDPERDTRNCNTSAARFSNLLERGRHGYRSRGFSHAYHRSHQGIRISDSVKSDSPNPCPKLALGRTVSSWLANSEERGAAPLKQKRMFFSSASYSFVAGCCERIGVRYQVPFTRLVLYTLQSRTIMGGTTLSSFARKFSN